MEKTVYMCTSGEIVFRKSDKKQFEYECQSPDGFGHIMVRDPDDGKIHRVYGPDFEVFTFDNPISEIPAPDHYAIDILAYETVRLNEIWEQRYNQMIVIFHTDLPYQKIADKYAELKEIERKINQCREGIQWAWDRLI